MSHLRLRWQRHGTQAAPKVARHRRVWHGVAASSGWARQTRLLCWRRWRRWTHSMPHCNSGALSDCCCIGVGVPRLYGHCGGLWWTAATRPSCWRPVWRALAPRHPVYARGCQRCSRRCCGSGCSSTRNSSHHSRAVSDAWHSTSSACASWLNASVRRLLHWCLRRRQVLPSDLFWRWMRRWHLLLLLLLNILWLLRESRMLRRRVLHR